MNNYDFGWMVSSRCDKTRVYKEILESVTDKKPGQAVLGFVACIRNRAWRSMQDDIFVRDFDKAMQRW